MSEEFEQFLGADSYFPRHSNNGGETSDVSAIKKDERLSYQDAVSRLHERLINRLKMEMAIDQVIAYYPEPDYQKASISGREMNTPVTWFCPKDDKVRNAFYITLMESRSGEFLVSIHERGKGQYGGHTGHSYTFSSVVEFETAIDELEKRADFSHSAPLRRPVRRLADLIGLPSQDQSERTLLGALQPKKVSPRIERIRRGILAIAIAGSPPASSNRKQQAVSRPPVLHYNRNTGLPSHDHE